MLLSPSLVFFLCSDLATLQSTESTFGSVDFQGVGGSPELRRTTRSGDGGSPERYPLSILGFRVGAGGLERWPGRRRTDGGELFRGGEAALGLAVRLVVAGGSGGCRLKMNCRPSLNYMSSASLLPLRSVSTVAFRFHNKFQF